MRGARKKPEHTHTCQDYDSSKAEEGEKGNNADVNMTDNHPAHVQLYIEYLVINLLNTRSLHRDTLS